jgi:hypothetical protein
MVERAQFGTVLERERGQVSIGCQIASGAGREQEIAQYFSVAGAWMDYGRRRLFEPGIYDVEGFLDSEGVAEDIWSGRQSKEGEEDNPRKSNRFRSGERSLPPRLGFVVQGRISIDSV